MVVEAVGNVVWVSSIWWLVLIDPKCGYRLIVWVSMGHGPSQPINNVKCSRFVLKKR
jgi:hypothetical protein